MGIFALTWQATPAQAVAAEAVDGLLASILKQSPALAVMLLMTYAFMRYIRERDQDAKAREAIHAETMKTIGDSCHEVQQRAINAIEKNTLALGRVSEALHRMNGHAKG